MTPGNRRDLARGANSRGPIPRDKRDAHPSRNWRGVLFPGGLGVRVRVRVPATTANFGPAFDVLGLALSLHNEVDLETADTTQVTVTGEGEGRLSTTATNLVARAAEGVAHAA